MAPLPVVEVDDLDAALAEHQARGYRVDRVSPADSPWEIDVSIDGADALCLRRRGDRPADEDRESDGPIVSLIAEADDFGSGRAGMAYRDLIPGRLGGRFIASHIRVGADGPVADYPHHHRVRFQMIYCVRGWARLVYEDQGDPFRFEAGDCVLQPAGIRHQVLEAGGGLEVVEVGAPAVHDTFADHDITLPTGRVEPDRDFAGQRFVHHVAASSPWLATRQPGLTIRDIGFGPASDGVAGARVVRVEGDDDIRTPWLHHDAEFMFVYILAGSIVLGTDDITHTLEVDDSAVVPRGPRYAMRVAPGTDYLEVTLPATPAVTPA
ncbi:MAG: cupin domain-containing protein [Actinomycetota bacterium]